MAGIGDGFLQGLQIGTARRERKKDREMEQARMEMEARRHQELLDAQKSLQSERLKRDVDMSEADRQLRRELTDKEITSRAMTLDKTLGAESARENARLKARGNEAAMEQIGRSAGNFQRFVAGQKPPTGRVKRMLDPEDPAAGDVTYDVPLSEIDRARPAPADAYQSPYAKDITDAESQYAEQNAQMAEGDSRGGFLGMQSRKGIAEEQGKRLVRLKALELQDKVAKGLLSQDQAEAEAERIKKTYGL